MKPKPLNRLLMLQMGLLFCRDHVQRWHRFMNPSTRFKDAFKIAPAIVITCAIALSQGWETPFWAGFAVAFCGLTVADENGIR